MSSAPPSPSLRSLFSELEQLFQSETEARVSTSVQAAERALAEHLNQSVRRLRQTAGFSELAAVLADASGPFAGACGIFQVTESAVSGETVRGVANDAVGRFRELRFSAKDAAAFAGAIESREPVVALCSPSEIYPAIIEIFGHAATDKAHLFPLSFDQTCVGILYATGTVESAALELLTQSTAAVMESRQRSGQQQPSAPDADLVHIKPAAAPSAGRKDWDELTLAERQMHLRAQRFARVRVAEMRLYRQDAVKAGRARSDIYAALQESIDAGREEFRQGFMAVTSTMPDYFHQELVRTLANDNPAWLGEKYPGPLVQQTH